MAEIVLFHHALGLTDGVRRFAERLASGGHTVRTPDLFGGLVFKTVVAGVAYAQELGFDTVTGRGEAAAGEATVFAGFSLGALPAQLLAQTSPRARAVLLYHACVRPEAFDSPWPEGLAAQIHLDEDDDLTDVDVALEFAEAGTAEVFLYDGDSHLFTDSSTPEYDEAKTDLVAERSLALLSSL